jgi:type II secretory pathway component PulF
MSDKETRRSGCAEVFSIFGTLSAHFFTLVVVFFVLIKVAPSYLPFFEDFDLELPASTQLVITISQLTINYWYLLFPIALLVDASLVVLLRLNEVTRLWLLPLWCNLWYLGVIMLLFIVAVGLCLPIASIAQGIPATPPPPPF